MEDILGMTNEPKLKVIFSKRGEEKARALDDEQIKAIDYVSNLYFKAMNELWVLNEHEKQPKPVEAPKQ